MGSINRDYVRDYLSYLNERLLGAECAALRDIKFASDDEAYATRRWARFDHEVTILLRERDRVVALLAELSEPISMTFTTKQVEQFGWVTPKAK